MPKNFHFKEMRGVACSKGENRMPTIDQIEKFNELNSLQAAMASPAMKPIIRLLASADVTLQGKVSIHELDRKLAGSRLSSHERMLVKTGLHHVGLLD